MRMGLIFIQQVPIKVAAKKEDADAELPGTVPIKTTFFDVYCTWNQKPVPPILKLFSRTLTTEKLFMKSRSKHRAQGDSPLVSIKMSQRTVPVTLRTVPVILLLIMGTLIFGPPPVIKTVALFQQILSNRDCII